MLPLAPSRAQRSNPHYDVLTRAKRAEERKHAKHDAICAAAGLACHLSSSRRRAGTMLHRVGVRSSPSKQAKTGDSALPADVLAASSTRTSRFALRRDTTAQVSAHALDDDILPSAPSRRRSRLDQASDVAQRSRRKRSLLDCGHHDHLWRLQFVCRRRPRAGAAPPRRATSPTQGAGSQEAAKGGRCAAASRNLPHARHRLAGRRAASGGGAPRRGVAQPIPRKAQARRFGWHQGAAPPRVAGWRRRRDERRRTPCLSGAGWWCCWHSS